MGNFEQSDVPAAKYWASEYPKRIGNTKRPRNVKPNATATTVPHATTATKWRANTTTTKPPAIQPLANGLSS